MSIICLLAPASTYAYVIGQETFEPDFKEKNLTHQLLVGIHTLSFIHNSEYFGPLVQGRTLIGYQFHPYLSYYSTNKLRVAGGVFMRRDGADVRFFSQAYPTFSIHYQSSHFAWILGHMQTNNQHVLIKPLSNLDSLLLRGPETGLQLRYLQKNHFIDVWLEWLSLLSQEANKPEELCAGLNAYLLLFQHTGFQLGLPIQVLLYHVGGQGITAPTYSLLVGALGTKIAFPMSKFDGLKSITWENYYVFSRYIKEIIRPFKCGQAFYSQVSFKTAWLDIIGSYWQGVGFSSENIGQPLYQSIALSNKKIIYQERIRQLFFLQFNYTYQLADQVILGLQIEPYYDWGNKLLEHAEGLYIQYSPLFKLGEIKRVEF